MTDGGQLRIGELSRRSGVSPELLRAWERRYGLLRPSRSQGGLRLYSSDDLARVRAMRAHLADGLAAAEAAALASERALPEGESPVSAVKGRNELAAALEQFDEAGAHDVLDSLLAQLSLDAILRDVVIPYLHELGTGWERGDISIAQEHFASRLLHGRLLGLARGWGRGLGAIAVLACAPGEHHELGLIAFGLALRARGWRILYLGADTPLQSIADAARSAEASCVVISAVLDRSFTKHSSELAMLAEDFQLCLAGPGAAKSRFDARGVLRLSASPVEEADRLTRLARG